MAFAEHQFKLSAPQKAGGTLRDHLEAAERQSGRRPAALDGPDCPAAAAHVWAWFLDLHLARAGSGFGPNPIGWGEIRAWARLTGAELQPWEARALRAVDRAWLGQQASSDRASN